MRYKIKVNVLALSSYFVIGIFALVIIFSCFIVSREYAGKDILPLSTSPSGKAASFGAKILVMALFCLISVIIFFTIIGIYSIDIESNYGRLAVKFGNIVTSISYDTAFTTAACMTLFGSIMVGDNFDVDCDSNQERLHYTAAFFGIDSLSCLLRFYNEHTEYSIGISAF